MGRPLPASWALNNGPSITREPGVLCAWFSHKAQVFRLVQGQCLVDMASRVDKGSLRSLLGHREYVLLVPQLLSTAPTLIYADNVNVLFQHFNFKRANHHLTCKQAPCTAQESWVPSWASEWPSLLQGFFPSKSLLEAVWPQSTWQCKTFVLQKLVHFYHDKSAGSSGRQSTAVILAIPNFESSAFTLSAR